MSDKANDQLKAAAELVLVRKLKSLHEDPSSPSPRIIRVVCRREATGRKYQPFDEKAYVFGPDAAIVAGIKGSLSTYNGEKFGFVDGVAYVVIDELSTSETRKQLDQHGYILSFAYLDEEPEPEEPPAGAEPCKNSSEQTEL